MKKIDFEKLQQYPKIYRFNQLLRFTTIFFGLLALVLSVFIVIDKLNADSSIIAKILPFFIAFLAINSLLKNLLTVNTLIVSKKGLTFKYLLKKNKTIEFNNLKRMEFRASKPKAIRFIYSENGEQKKYIFPLVFRNILEIINDIVTLCPEIEYDDFLDKVIINEKDNNQT